MLERPFPSQVLLCMKSRIKSFLSQLSCTMLPINPALCRAQCRFFLSVLIFHISSNGILHQNRCLCKHEEGKAAHLKPLSCVQLVWTECCPHFIIKDFSCCSWQASQTSIFESSQELCQRPLQGCSALCHFERAECMHVNIWASPLARFQDLQVGLTCMQCQQLGIS